MLLMLLLPCCTAALSKICSSGVCLPPDYNKVDLPPTEQGGPVMVETTLFLIDLFDIDPNTLTLHLSMYIRLKWKDNRINVENMTEIYVNIDQDLTDKLWKPDIYIWGQSKETAFSKFFARHGISVSKEDDSVLIQFAFEIDIGVVWPMDFSMFPFDINDCKFRMSSWNYKSDKLILYTNENQSPDMQLDQVTLRNSV
jgi:hypothetical protein